jgi:hypothetical protein
MIAMTGRGATALAAALVVCACADGPRTVVTAKASDNPQFVTASFPLWGEVPGKSYGPEAEGVAATITAAMKQAYAWNPSNGIRISTGSEHSIRTPKDNRDGRPGSPSAG